MKLFDSARPDGSAEYSAAAVRLNSIVERGQAECCFYGTHPPQKVDAIQRRRFWTLPEIEAESDSR